MGNNLVDLRGIDVKECQQDLFAYSKFWNHMIFSSTSWYQIYYSLN